MLAWPEVVMEVYRDLFIRGSTDQLAAVVDEIDRSLADGCLTPPVFLPTRSVSARIPLLNIPGVFLPLQHLLVGLVVIKPAEQNHSPLAQEGAFFTLVVLPRLLSGPVAGRVVWLAAALAEGAVGEAGS
jgi:hypothetical protein